MYTDRNFKTKKALKEAFKRWDEQKNKPGPHVIPPISVYQPGGMFPSQKDGNISIEGPHFPKPHTWYARARIKDSIIIKILG